MPSHGPQFAERELDIMNVLWREGSATTPMVRQHLEEDGIVLAHTSVQKMLSILEGKGYLRREQEGRTYRYFPLVARTDATASALKKLVRSLFDGSASLLVSQLLTDRSLSRAEVRKIRALLDEPAPRTGGKP